MLRLPDGMRRDLKEAARAAKRTMNAEIVARLEKSLQDEVPNFAAEEFAPKSAVDQLTKEVKDLQDRVQALEGKK